MHRRVGHNKNLNGKTFNPAKLLEEVTGLKSSVTRNLSCEDEPGPEVFSVMLSEGTHPDVGPLIEKVTEAFEGKGYVVFMGLPADEARAPLCVVRGESKMDILRAAVTEAPNYDFTTEDIIRYLAEIEKIATFEIMVASSDTAFLLFDPPVNKPELVAQMLFELCHDLSQGELYDVEQVEKRLRSDEPFIPLWWD